MHPSLIALSLPPSICFPLIEGVEEVAEGAITVELQTTLIEEFDEYFKKLTPLNNLRNPWFPEYWEAVFGCRLSRSLLAATERTPEGEPGEEDYPSSGLTNGGGNTSGGSLTKAGNTVPICSPALRIDENVGYRQETKVQFVVDAVYAFAYALNAAWKAKCFKTGSQQTGHGGRHASLRHTAGHGFFGNGSGNHAVCKDLKEMDGGDFYKHFLLEADFTGELHFFSSLSPLLAKERRTLRKKVG